MSREGALWIGGVSKRDKSFIANFRSKQEQSFMKTVPRNDIEIRKCQTYSNMRPGVT